MEEFFDMEKTRAFVYLKSSGDEANKVLISYDQICIIYREKRTVLQLKRVSSLGTDYRKMLLPLILGGILTPFAFLSYFVNLMLPWVHLISVLLGLLLFYVGWTGRAAFTVLLANKDELIYYVPSISLHLKAFVEYVNSFLTDPAAGKQGSAIYIEVGPDKVPALFGENRSLEKSLFPLFGYTHEQHLKKRSAATALSTIAIDPLLAGREIRFEYNAASKQMRPLIDGPIRKEAIIREIYPA